MLKGHSVREVGTSALECGAEVDFLTVTVPSQAVLPAALYSLLELHKRHPISTLLG